MTLNEFLHGEIAAQYEECAVEDKKGNGLNFWHEDDDPKYNAEVIGHHLESVENEGTLLIITVDNLFLDERGFCVTEKELRHDYYAEDKCAEMTFDEYVKECCGKNGTLERII